MNIENQNLLKESFPTLLDSKTVIQVGDGWIKLLENTLDKIIELDESKKCRIDTIKTNDIGRLEIKYHLDCTSNTGIRFIDNIVEHYKKKNVDTVLVVNIQSEINKSTLISSDICSGCGRTPAFDEYIGIIVVLCRDCKERFYPTC